jgi:peptidoglycan glycosyltransferase
VAIKARVRVVALFLLVLFLAPVVNLTRLQVLRSEELSKRPDNSRTMEDLSLRGSLLDRTGQPLAHSRKGSRVYPLGPITGPLLGYMTGRLGSAGLEASLEEQTAGYAVPRTPMQAWNLLARGERRGDDVVLTLDRGLQKLAWELLEGFHGAALLLDIPTGEILAVASRPSFDPETLEDDWERLRVDPAAPLIERGTQGLYPPGSTFKILTMAGALADGRTTADEVFACTGSMDAGNFILHDNAVHGPVRLEEALVVSCNVTFATLGQRLGVEGLRRWMDEFGILDELPLVPNTSAARPAQSEAPSAAAEAGIGQADLLLSPLAMARVTAALARGGVDLEPRLIRAQTRRGKETWRPPAPRPHRVLQRSVAEEVGRAMTAVVARGTGGAAAVSGVAVAGKTGTAENPHGAPHAWFVGYAPADKPEVAVAILLENAGGGGAYAAPLASRLLQEALSP